MLHTVNFLVCGIFRQYSWDVQLIGYISFQMANCT